MFTPLHIYSSYSFLQSGLTIDRLVFALKEKGYESASLSDRQVLFGIPHFFDASIKASIKPLAALDLLLDGELLTLIALNEEGYLNLVAISSLLSSIPVTDQILSEHKNGLLMILSTKQGALYSSYRKDANSIPSLIHRYEKLNSSFYLGVEIYEEKDIEFATFIRETAAKYNYETIAFPFIKYHKESDAIILKITEAIANDFQIELKEENGPYFVPELKDIEARYTRKEIENTSLISSLCDFKFDIKRGKLLHFPGLKNKTASLYLRELAIVGLQARNIDFTNITYLNRLDYELRMIDEMGYSDYFLIVSDYIHFAREQGIPVGPGRGSAPGSLVSYAIEITEIDPLKYNLLFERFLNPSRRTMPDIDIDFGDIRREEIIDYLRKKYGENRVANIITFQTIQAKQALRDIGRIYQYSPRTIEALSKSLPDSKLDLRTAYKKIPSFKNLVEQDKECFEILKLATKIEGLIRQSGLHAAGIVLNEEPIIKSLPVLSSNGHFITQYEMDYLENQGYLKMDILGLRNLTIIERTISLIKENHGIDLNYRTIPFLDKKIFDLLRTGMTMGIFQLESEGMRRAIKEIKPTCFDDIVILLAIFRPGPMENIASYAARKEGKENVSILDPELKDILAPTLGIIIYQEQIMQIAEKMAGFSLADADNFRRAVSKKDATKLKGLQDSFVEGAIRKGYNSTQATSVFNHINKFADYGFNKSHSVAYAVLACQMAYLKVTYPYEFYASILENSSAINDSKFSEYIEELNSLKIGIMGPDVNASELNFIVFQKKLLFPFTAVRGINNELATNIIEARAKQPFKDFFDFINRLFRYKITAKQLEHLIDAGAFDRLHKSRATLRSSISNALQNASIHDVSDNPTGQLFETSAIPNARLNPVEDDPIENVDREQAILGLVLSASPFKHKKEKLKSYILTSISEVKNTKGTLTIGGIVRSKKVIKTKSGSPMAFLTVFDDTGVLDVVLFSRIFAEVATSIEKNKLVVITGHIELEKGNNLIAERIVIIED